jgi:branched-subunit amino acid transport protein
MTVVVLISAAGIFALRASFIVSAGRFELPARCTAALRHTRPAVLGALLMSSTVEGGPASLPDTATLVVLALVAVVARRSAMGPTVLAGMGAITVLGVLGV